VIKATTNATYDIQYHFVWVPKYRKRLLQGPIKERLAELIRLSAEINEFELLELSIQADHVHLLLSAKPRYSPAKIMHLIKGGTSRQLRQEFPQLEESLWGDSFWADGYFVSTHGQWTEATVRHYIQHQGPPPEAAAFRPQ
jgi:putative transposase